MTTLLEAAAHQPPEFGPPATGAAGDSTDFYPVPWKSSSRGFPFRAAKSTVWTSSPPPITLSQRERPALSREEKDGAIDLPHRVSAWPGALTVSTQGIEMKK